MSQAKWTWLLVGLLLGVPFWFVLLLGWLVGDTKEFLFLLLCLVCMIVGFLLLIACDERDRAERAQQWPVLSGIVNGTLVGDNLTGTYLGFPVAATVLKYVEHISGAAPGLPITYFVLMMFIGSQGKNWLLCKRYKGRNFLGFGPRSWHVESKDEALTQRLVNAGLIAAMENWQRAHDVVVYDAEQGSLMYAAGTWFDGRELPSAEEFNAQLHLLVHLANINKQVNVE